MTGFEDRFVRAGGMQTRYWSAGQGGVPLVLLHGLASSVEDWRPVLPGLAAGRRVIAVDLLGCGQTEKRADLSYSPEQMGSHVIDLLNQLDLGQVDLLGWSMGGRIALDVAHALTARVRRLVLVAPAGVGPDTDLALRLVSLPMLGELLSLPSRPGLRMMARRGFCDPAGADREFVETRLRLARLPGARRAALCQLRALAGVGGFRAAPRAELLQRIAGLPTRTLAVWGCQDRMVPPDHARILGDTLPYLSTVTIEDCGHFPQHEQPDHFARAVMGFLDAPAASAEP